MELHASNDEVKDDVFNDENVEQAMGENLDKQHAQGKHPEEDLVDKLPLLQGNVELVETATIAEKMNAIESIVHGGNNDVILQKEVLTSHKINGTCILFYYRYSQLFLFIFSAIINENLRGCCAIGSGLGT